MTRSAISNRIWARAASRWPASGALPGLELSPIKAIELEASRIPGVISLAQGIPSFDTPEPIKQFVLEKIREGACAKYSVTPGLPVLREAIAESLRRDGMHFDPDREILVTAGSIEAIAATLLASIEPGDEVLVVSPTYASYLPAIQIAGGIPRFVALNEDANFDLDPDAIAEAVRRRTRAIILCNPNNPTGTIFSREQTLRMLAVAEEHDLLVIADEVYKDFVYGSTQIYSAARETDARHRVIRVCSFSKAYAMTGWRVGFLHGAEELVREILSVHDALVTCAPVASQYAALAALELGDAAIAEFRAEYRRRRDQVLGRLEALPHVFDFQKPNASYFVFPRIKDTVPFARDSRRLTAELLHRAHVALVPGVAFGPTGEAHVRICYARPAEDLDRAFDRLDDFFAGRPARTSVDVRPLVPGPARPPWYRLRGVGMGVLRHLARTYLRRQRPRIVAVTGSQGKTVMKRFLVEMLGTRFRVRANPLSYNTEIGVPLAILGCALDTGHLGGVLRGFLAAAWAAYVAPARTEVLILELGVRHAGDMRAHLDIVRPDVVILTPLVPSLSQEEGLEVLRQEIATLCTALRGNNRAMVLACADDPVLTALTNEVEGARFFSKADGAPADGGWIFATDAGRFVCRRDLVGVSSLHAVAAAVRVASWLGMNAEQIDAVLRTDVADAAV